MSTFKIGQRVRVRQCENAHLYGDCSGRAGVIWQEIDNNHNGHGWAVAVDGWPKFRANGYPNWFLDRQLEPVIPEGAAPSEHTFHQLMGLLTAGEVANV